MSRQKLAGVLIPLFSMRREGDAGIGDLHALEEWIDWASKHSVQFLQLLPVNALGPGDAPSPYSSISSVALEPLYLSLERIPGVPSPLPTQAQDLPPQQFPGGKDWVDYNRVRLYKEQIMHQAWENFQTPSEFIKLKREWKTWEEAQGAWLNDFVSFKVASIYFNTNEWWRWPEQNPEHIRAWVQHNPELQKRAQYESWLQWLCALEWAQVRSYADVANVKLMGDVPIGISVASADVFFERHLFDMNWSGGAPPEGNFAEDPFTGKWGQNWGIPLYRWDVMKQTDFAWWKRRITKLGEIFSMYRIDHILGFYRIYAFPWMPDRNEEFLHLTQDEAARRCDGNRPGFRNRPDDSAENCKQNLMQGDELLRRITAASHGQIVIGEDLGCVPDYVRPNLSQLRIAGFKIPHWEIDTNQKIIKGYTYNPCSFATFATHDFPPISADWKTWYNYVQAGLKAQSNKELNASETTEAQRIGRDCARVLEWLGDYAGLSPKESIQDWGPPIKNAIFRALMACNSNYVTLMWTELFDLDVRLNTPGTEGGGNWRARIPFNAAEAASMPQSTWMKEIGQRH